MATYRKNSKLTFLQKMLMAEVLAAIVLSVVGFAVNRQLMPALGIAMLHVNAIQMVPRTAKAGQRKSLLFAFGLVMTSFELVTLRAAGKPSAWGTMVTALAFVLAVVMLSTALLVWDPPELGAE